MKNIQQMSESQVANLETRIIELEEKLTSLIEEKFTNLKSIIFMSTNPQMFVDNMNANCFYKKSEFHQKWTLDDITGLYRDYCYHNKDDYYSGHKLCHNCRPSLNMIRENFN